MKAVVALGAIGLGAFAIYAAVIVVLRALSWPQRLRWMIASNSMCCIGTGLPSPLDLREVVLLAVEESPSGVELSILEVGRTDLESREYSTGPQAADVANSLADLCALRTPMLLCAERSNVSLYGPMICLADLHPLPSPATHDSSSRS